MKTYYKLTVKLDQHFLVCEEVNKDIIKAIAIKKDDIVLEIGPGKGATTRHIPHAKKVILVEKEPDFIPLLKAQFPLCEVILGDGVKEISRHCFDKLVCNTPFQIVEPLLNELFLIDFKTGVLILPDNYYKRIKSNKTIHALYASSFLNIKKIREIKRGCFSPVPRTDCVLVSITKKKELSIYRDIYMHRDMKLKNYLVFLLTRSGIRTKKEAKEHIKNAQLWIDNRITQLNYQMILNANRFIKALCLEIFK